MKLIQAIAIIVITTLICGLIGMGIGNAIGTANPGYYRSFFRPERFPNFDPAAFGRGQGFSQGLGSGVAISLVLVIVFAWQSRRTRILKTLDELRQQVHQLQQVVERMQKERGKTGAEDVSQ